VERLEAFVALQEIASGKRSKVTDDLEEPIGKLIRDYGPQTGSLLARYLKERETYDPVLLRIGFEALAIWTERGF